MHGNGTDTPEGRSYCTRYSSTVMMDPTGGNEDRVNTVPGRELKSKKAAVIIQGTFEVRHF